MKRQLSGSDTLFWKYVFPAFWAMFIPLIVLAALSPSEHLPSYKGEPPSHFSQWMMVAFWTGGLIWLVRLVSPLRRVWRDDTALYVATWQGDMIVSFNQIVSVREIGEMPIGGRKPLIIELQTPSPIGQQIQFLPLGTTPFGLPSRQRHPVLVELESLIEDDH